ncbi:hypothetical protein [Streptacidiphilus jeojiense]|uniref:hypothetical protein n=1 Tax=Streptacidiphilus jeojiense TaxID=436229 RepID=UPI001E620377|nr:hypothetical protein [Streptacidiphilus jeojiense]
MRTATRWRWRMRWRSTSARPAWTVAGPRGRAGRVDLHRAHVHHAAGWWWNN